MMNMKKLFLIIFFAFLFIPNLVLAQPWWNSSWSYRQQINITNNNITETLEANYTINITFDHQALVLAGKSVENGTDVRVVWFNTSLGDNIELDRLNSTTFNLTNTVIWFKLQENITANSWDANYYLYYGNSLADVAPANGSNVYLFYDDFSDGDYTNDPTWTHDYGTDTWFVKNNRWLTHSTTSRAGINSSVDFVATGFISEFSIQRIGSTTDYGGDPYVRLYSGSDYYAFYWAPDSTSGNMCDLIKYDGATTTLIDNTHAWATNTEYKIKIVRDQNGNFELFVDGNSKGTAVDSVFSSFTTYRFLPFDKVATADGGDAIADTKLRKYIFPEPTTSLGDEQLKPPQWFNPSYYYPESYSPEKSTFNITWTTEQGVSIVFFESNFSGEKNYTMFNISNIYSFNETLPAGSFYWKSYANDSNNIWSVSDTFYFTINKAIPELKLFLNGTQSNRNYLENTPANFTAFLSRKTIYMDTNISGWVLQSGFEKIINITTPTLIKNYTVYNITAYFPGDQNYSFYSKTYYATITKIPLITINLALHLGELFEDDSIQANNYICISDIQNFFGLISESPIQVLQQNQTNNYNINTTQTSDSKIFLAASKGGCSNFLRYRNDIFSKNFLKPLIAFAYPQTNILKLILRYNADILNNIHFGKGTYQILIKNQGYDQTQEKQKLGIEIIK